MSGAPSPCHSLKLLVCLLAILQTGGQESRRDEKIFTNGWAIRVHGGVEEAKKIAKAHGFEKVEPVSLSFTKT